MRSTSLLAFVPICMFLVRGALAEPAPRVRPIDPPEVYVSWNAAWGEPAAARNRVADCADTTAADTLYLTIRSPHNVVPLLGMTVTLLFEPQQGDSLGSFWFFERGGANAGSLLIDFDLLSSDNCSSPWKAFVAGHVGYAHTSRRGRLDLSAGVPLAKVYNLNPSDCYFFGRVSIRRARGGLAGCRRPMRITCVGAKFRTSRKGSESLAIGPGPERSVTWNAAPRGVACKRTGLAVETWVPRRAPPSWGSMTQLPDDPSAAPEYEH